MIQREARQGFVMEGAEQRAFEKGLWQNIKKAGGSIPFPFF